jgi:hypothetical protein
MKHRIVILMLAVILYGCDPSYNCYVRNDSPSVLYLKTHPSIESQVDAQSIVYDSILAYRLHEEGKLSVYRIKPHGVFRIYGHIGFNPSIEEMPFDYVEIIQGTDTVILDSKEKILARLEQEGKTRKFFIQE